MRDDSLFIGQLRGEIISSQGHRTSLIKLKLGFLVSLLGLGAISSSAQISTTPLLYLVPLVAIIFDLYILGEDFGIKRAGCFIKTSPAASIEEKIWENSLDSARDWFSFIASPLTTFVAFITASIGIRASKMDFIPFYLWVISSLVLIIILLFSRRSRKRTLCQLESTILKKRKELSKDTLSNTDIR